MERIAAASNLIIEVEPQRWRLLSNGGGEERVLVEAAPGEPLRYGESFGSRRQLPASGMLTREDIQRVVLGWSSKDNAWHLGLVLGGALVTERGSRWCGLVHWNDPNLDQYEKIATQAGQLLAEQVNRPFSVIPPNASEGTAHTAADTGMQPTPPTAQTRQPYVEPASSETIPAAAPPVRSYEMPTAASYSGAQSYEAPAAQAPVYAPPADDSQPIPQPIPQPALPLKFELWTLKQADPMRVELVLAKSWTRGRLMRILGNVVWLVIFILLTVTTLTAGIALPRPEILVYLGIAAIILLTVNILYNLLKTFTTANRIIFEPEGVRWQRGKRIKKAIPADQIAEVYVSHVLSKVGKRGKAALERALHHGEINLYLLDGEFESVLVQTQTDEMIPVTDDPINEESVEPLTVYNARTRLQAAALKMAQVLNLPAEYDKRMR